MAKAIVADAPHPSTEERPCVCYKGVVYIGHMVDAPDTGEEAEVFEAVPCRRCVR